MGALSGCDNLAREPVINDPGGEPETTPEGQLMH